MFTLRSWIQPDDTVAVQQLASRLWPASSHPGGLGWEAAIDQLPAATILAERDGQIVGWAGVTGGEIVVEGDPQDPDAASYLLEWAVDQAGELDLGIPVFDSDEPLRALVVRAGFTPQSEGSALTGLFHPVTTHGPELPTGYRIRGMRDGEDAQRVAVHRAAWRPATLPWPEHDTYEIDPDATSRFTADHFARLRQVWLYDQELDLVVEAPNGEFAGCCTVWWDPATGCAQIEPLGIAPEHRRKGLATALSLEVCAQIGRRGGREVFINTWHLDSYPAPAATYLAAGFTVRRRATIYRRAK